MSSSTSKTAAWPLAFAYMALIVYASLYPFESWRNQGLPVIEFLRAPLPKYWTVFDVLVNVLGYVPMGLLLAWALSLRRGLLTPIVSAIVLTSVLSLSMEEAQTYLPSRVPSNLDWLLNTAGGAIGAFLCYLLQHFGVLARWRDWKRQWFVGEPRGVLVLLALWPLALIFPSTYPFGLGQISYRVYDSLDSLMRQVGLEWLQIASFVASGSMSSWMQWACIVLGLLVPCLLAYSIMRTKWMRWTALWGIALFGVLMVALSFALSFGPIHAWVWITPVVPLALAAALVFGTGLLWVPRQACLALAVTGLIVQLILLSNAPLNTFLDQNLLAWEQGRFARFNGLSQWLAALWPYFLMGYASLHFLKREVIDT